MIINCVTINFSEKQLKQLHSLLDEQKVLEFLIPFDDYLEFVNSEHFLLTDLVFVNVDDTYQNMMSKLHTFLFNGCIIFVSANKLYAYDAIKIGAIDFLLSPISKHEFQEAIKKVVLFKKSKKIKKHKKGDYIYIKSNSKNIKVYVSSIKWIRALGDYVKIFCENHTYVVLSTMKVFEDKLSKYSFLRIHKSYIINLKKIDQLTTKEVFIDNEMIPLSRTKKPILFSALNIN